jgi:putative ABC transport system substrate-binding protein
MNRRDTVLALIVLGVAPFAVEAQPATRILRMGFLNPGAFAGNLPSEEFFKILGNLGWIEGQNIAIERKEAKGDAALLSRFAQDLVVLQPDLIVTNTTIGAMAAQKATRSIPIVMINVSDPVNSGFTTSLGRPSANMTGVATNMMETNQKRVQLIKEIVPSASRIALLGNTDNQGVVALMREAVRGASALGLKVESLAFSGVEGLNAILAKPVNAQALLLVTDAVTSNRREMIARFAVTQRLPAIGQYPEEAIDGLLAAYGPSLRANWGKAAIYADKILRGAKPADLPIEEPSVIELVINLKTAKALGIKIPQSVLVRADQVIE